jgi:hypothetical protein
VSIPVDWSTPKDTTVDSRLLMGILPLAGGPFGPPLTPSPSPLLLSVRLGPTKTKMSFEVITL